MNESQFKIVGKGDGGTLCHEAEKYLHDDLGDEGVALINDTFIMKDFGKNVMVAIKTLEVEGGTIEPGYWYDFDWYVLRSNVRHKANYFGKRIHIPGIVEIKRSREIYERTGNITTRDELLEGSVQAARKLSKLAITEIEYPLPYPPFKYSKV